MSSRSDLIVRFGERIVILRYSEGSLVDCGRSLAARQTVCENLRWVRSARGAGVSPAFFGSNIGPDGRATRIGRGLARYLASRELVARRCCLGSFPTAVLPHVGV